MSRGGSEQTRQQIEMRRQAAEKLRAQRKSAKASRKRACIHLGKRAGAADAYGPRGVDCAALHACALYKLCSIKRKLPGISHCKSCDDYVSRPAKKTAVADGKQKK